MSTQDSAFYVYAKAPDARRAYPLGRNGLAKNLVHAIRFQDHGDDRARVVANLAEDNPGWTFEARPLPRRKDAR